MKEALDAVLDPFRPGFDADGFDVTIDSVGPDVVQVELKHEHPA